MGKSGIYNYEVQVQDPGSGNLLLIGAMKFQEATDKLFAEARRIGSTLGYIWPQTKLASKKINNIPWVTNHNGIDYLKITIELNTPQRKRYKLAGINLIDQTP